VGISREDVLRVARLAHIDLTEAETAALPAQLDRIIAYVESLEAVPIDADGAADAAPATPLRADEARASLPLDEALGGAPARRGDFFGVPRVIGADDGAA
jgi:aspartyl-tRNA(Asn)/glutamyl-tRNA(Gln) amidotransferase subunit C